MAARDVCARIKASRSHWLALVAAGLAPQPAIRRPRFTRWLATDVAAWIALHRGAPQAPMHDGENRGAIDSSALTPAVDEATSMPADQRLSTARARLEQKGYSLQRTMATDGSVRFCVGRKRMTLNLTDLDAVECFLTDLEARE